MTSLFSQARSLVVWISHDIERLLDTVAPNRFAGTFLFVLTIGQCAYFGAFGNSTRISLHQSTIELKIADQRIEELSQLDELTGVLNRRHIMKSRNDEMARAQRSNVPCSVAIIDLDFFKKINDQFGHPAGDEALRTFAISIFANIRTIDKFGRYGGAAPGIVRPLIVCPLLSYKSKKLRRRRRGFLCAATRPTSCRNGLPVVEAGLQIARKASLPDLP
jgi:hypothetical protein